MSRLGKQVRRGVVALAMAGLAAVLLPAAPALAHCDSVSGPVVTAARQALEQNDVKLILPYIQATDEAELIAAFREAQAARQQGGKAAEVANRWFFETAVRLHRQGEGEPYTGLKENVDYGPALEAAEEALAGAPLERVAEVLDEAVREQLETRYKAVAEAREQAATEGTVAANRERVEAELQFAVYVHGLYEAIEANGEPHGETLLPLRAVAEAAGATVTWDAQEQAATVQFEGRSLVVKPGTEGAALIKDRLMVPVRLLTEALGVHSEAH